MKGWSDISAACRAGHDAYRAGLGDPGAVQDARLREILSANAESDAGRRYGFAVLRDWDDYRAAVPIGSYADIAGDVERMAAGEPGRLTCAPVVACEVTSGSGAAAKLVPYTAAGLAGFRRAIEPWLFDLLQSRPRIAQGRAYWAISPVGRRTSLPAPGATIDLGNDVQYLGSTLAPLLAAVLAVPLSLGRMSDVEAWRYRLLLHLLHAEDVSFISVWSPTFLLPVLDLLRQEGDRLAYDLDHGTCSWPTSDPGAPAARFDPRPLRADALRGTLSGARLDVTALWPRLDTLSCWTHASAARYLGDIEHCMPGVMIQGKGLLATEAAVSVPLAGFEYPVLAIDSACYEFIDGAGASRLAHEVDAGQLYRVVVTTDSGLYRYDLADTVRVRGFAQRTPMLEFVGRAGLVSDLCGEKLAEDFVAGALVGLRGFAMLAQDGPQERRYVLLLDAGEYDELAAARAALQVEDRLQFNPHYAYARRLRQLAPLAALRVRNPLAGIVALGLARGRRLGDIKPLALEPSADWLDHFAVVPASGTHPALAGTVTSITGVTP